MPTPHKIALSPLQAMLLPFLLVFCNSTAQTDMKNTLTVQKIMAPKPQTLAEVGKLLEEKTDLHTVGTVNWAHFSYAPKVRFRIGHAQEEIWLKFYVEEEHILARHTETNAATHRDSCVEFFVDPGDKGHYYNFEFNCIGTTHLAYGPNRKERRFVAAEVIEKELAIASSLGKDAFEERSGGHRWEMTVVIPKTVFTFTPGLSFDGLVAKANFYKCGDDTAQPHYLSWSPIQTENPDFHRPEFFGTLHFGE
ncbi:carbohydrate-binding family 9-like protein [Maribacter sp. 2307ULW6-5]|uniref:carbohydrate-binding family 9-like protein n=1 Tax=Maribacter sp. 2307ULW6-5 TaxID=3386275 RepID=UPI0039BC53C0